ncbi:hypothetical protein LXA43DRAFT_1097454 [Ganoderma leucocontextum]|nr:hypothetical protein LXA43DRAFT_1097454 [Ganoderma leucocontextum]
MKHLIAWLQEACGEDEIDARCRRLPPNHNLRHFANGISTMSRVTGKEHQDICRDLLGLIVGLRLPGGASSVRLVRATRALLDFLYLAQYPTQTSETLRLLDNALATFHANKSIFVDLGIRTHFRLPKLHSLDHYHQAIELFGTTDNYDTQYSERLHIDMAKDAYRATNRKDELEQMTIWLERKEKIQRHEKHVEWRHHQLAAQANAEHPPAASTGLVGRSMSSALPWPTAPQHHASIAPGPASTSFSECQSVPGTAKLRVEMTRHPTVNSVPLLSLTSVYGAKYFRDALTRYVVRKNNPGFTDAQVERHSASVHVPMQKVPVFHKVKFWISDPHGLAAVGTETRDVIHVRPGRKNKYGNDLPARFDTALVRVVFMIPKKAMLHLFPSLPVDQYPTPSEEP